MLLFSSCTMERRHYRNGFYIPGRTAASPAKSSGRIVTTEKITAENQLAATGISKTAIDTVVPGKETPRTVFVKNSITSHNRISAGVKKQPGKRRHGAAKIFYKKKDGYHARPFLVITAGLLSVFLVGLAVFLVIAGGSLILWGIIAALSAGTIAFLAFLSINDDETDKLPLLKRIILQAGRILLLITMIVLFPVTLLWFLIYINFMIRGDMN